MGKKNQAEKMSVEVLNATDKIAALATKQGITVVDHYAVLKELVKTGSVSVEQHFTRWGEVEGQRTLLVLCGDKLKSYPDYSTHFSSTKTIKV